MRCAEPNVFFGVAFPENRIASWRFWSEPACPGPTRGSDSKQTRIMLSRRTHSTSSRPARLPSVRQVPVGAQRQSKARPDSHFRERSARLIVDGDQKAVEAGIPMDEKGTSRAPAREIRPSDFVGVC